MVTRGKGSIVALLGVALMLVTLLAPQAAAQAGGSKQIISGQTVTWSADWTFRPDVSVADANVELLALGNGTSIVGYGGTSFPVGAAQVRDTLLKGFTAGSTNQQVDRGDYDNVSYSIDLSTSQAVTLAIFTLVMENPANTTMAMLITAPDQFQAAMTDAQAGIAVDGAPIFAGVDAAAMQQTITLAQPGTPPPQTIPAGGLGDPGSDVNGSTPAPAATASSASAPPNSATIASSGVEIRYSADWKIQTQDDNGLSLGTVAPPAVLVTAIDLGPVASSPDAAALAGSLQQRVESLADAEVVAALNPAPDRVVIVFRDPDPSGTLIRVYDIAIDPTATTAVTMIAGEADVRAGVQLVSTTIQVKGQPVMVDLDTLVPQLFGGE